MSKLERFGLVAAVVLALAALAYQGLKPQPEQQVGVMGVTNLDSLTLRDNLVVGKASSLGSGGLAVTGNISLSNGALINTKGAVTVTDQLYVASQVVALNGVSVAGNVTTTGQVAAGNGVAVTGNITVGTDLDVAGNAMSTSGSFRINDNTLVTGTLNVSGVATFNSLLRADTQLIAANGIDVSGGITAEVNSQNFVLPSVVSATIAYDTSGAVVTIPDGQIWIVKDVVLHVLTNFDCTGDNCAMTVGDGNDADGFLVLADAELQAADSEGTGFAAGWQGLVAATRGVYQDATTFTYAPSGAAETIDVAIAGTDPAAGLAVLYVFYTRIQ